MEYSKELNGIYAAKQTASGAKQTTTYYYYIVRFENGVSKEGIKGPRLFKEGIADSFFAQSAFTKSSGYDYMPADARLAQWLLACIEAKRFVDCPKTIFQKEFLIYN